MLDVLAEHHREPVIANSTEQPISAPGPQPPLGRKDTRGGGSSLMEPWSPGGLTCG
ncbi:hypothetical protein [Streptomyces sp. ISL-86]|uniref:hypothetical protein n=1 Tax=Streptomyces sp. ISL-86 TaxID=2819187 RepID=UPI001BE87092|nr:hypothetical protein [Streptomyces sp. ISL-86]